MDIKQRTSMEKKESTQDASRRPEQANQQDRSRKKKDQKKNKLGKEYNTKETKREKIQGPRADQL